MIRLLTFLTLFLPLVAFSPAALTPDVIVKVEVEKMTTDNIGNVYLIKGENISKYDAKGILQKSFSNKNFGAITSADATNALRIVLFYKDFNRVVTLDNTMSENGESIQLESLGFPFASLVASSHDNGIWIYDQQNFELIRMNRNLQVEHRSGNLSQMLGIELQPNFLVEKENRLFLNNPKTGILVFDIFGTYSKTIPVTEIKSLQIVNDKMVYFQSGKLSVWDLLTAEKSSFEEPHDTTALDMRMENNAVFVLKEKQLEIYEKK